MSSNPSDKKQAKAIEDAQEQSTALALGWMYAEACTSLDKEEDLRTQDLTAMLARARTDLGIPAEKQEYSYCAITKSKFLIMRRGFGSSNRWTKYAEALHETAAKHLTNALNAEKQPSTHKDTTTHG